MVIKKRFLYQMISCMICVCMIAGLSVGFPSSAYANDAVSVISVSQGSDIAAHWAENHIGPWLDKGLIKGFPDGTFGPDKAITRAEFMALVNRAYGFVEKSNISFTDVSSEDWFYGEVAKAVAAGYITGYNDGTVKPKSLISRQEAAMILSRLMNLAKHEDKNEIAKFSDYSSMPDWSKDAINSVVAEGYMKGNPNGTFMPIAAITRAETVVTLSRSAGEIYNLAGTYDEDKTIPGNATINTTGVTLENVVIEGNLFLTPGIGEGTVVLRNVTVKGKTIVAGGGKNSVIIDSCDLNEVVVTREDGIVRLSTQGNTTIKILVVEEGAIIDSALLSESGDILIVYLTAYERVELSGDFGTVHIVNPETLVDIINGSIENLIIDETASGSLINLSENATVNNMDVNAPVTVTGMGTIETAVIGEGAEETTFEKEPIKKEVVSATIPSTPSGGSTGGGGSSGGETETSPSLTADNTGNFIKTNIDILFTDDSTWRSAVSAVKVDGAPLTADTQYELIAGKLRLKTNAIQAMQVAGDYTITIEATDYQTASISQTIAIGLLGNGTVSEPFQVATAADLDKVRYYVGVPALYFKQTADIDLNTIDWQPIGIYDQTMVTDGGSFMGNYDGNDYYIENMKINYSSPTYSYGAGLFRNTKEATLNNIKLKGVDIDVPNTGLVGALVGEAKETNITGCFVENSTKVKGLQAVGGLVGYAYQSTISSSRADVLVYGETSINIISNGIGGFVGDSHSSTITGSSAHGNVSGNKEVGGFAGRIDYASIIGCFSDGSVTGTGDSSQDTGGFVGINYHATADQCYAISTVSGRNYVGGFAGRNIGTITNSYARGSVAYTGTVAGGFVGRIQNNAANLLGGAPSDTGYNYSDVAISGTGTKIGAFLGEHDTSAPGGSGTIHHNHYNLGIALVNQAGGANGLTLENMKKQISFPEWDFVSIWAIQEDVTTPYHRWEQTPTFTLTYTAGPNGSITGDTSQTITQGSDGTSVTAIPADGYEFINWSDESTVNPRTDSNVTNNISVTANFALIDDDPPVFSEDYPTVFSITDQEFRVGVAADKTGTAYYIVVADDATPPSSQQVKNRIDYGDVTVLRSGSMTIPIGEQPSSSSVLALQPTTDYDVYVVAESVGGVLQTTPTKLDARTLELQAPQFFNIIIGDGNYPRVENINGKQLDILAGFNNKPGKVYYIVVPENSLIPNTQQIIDGLDYDSVAISARGVFTIGVAGDVYTETVMGLDPLTAYDIYLVAADNSIPMNINPKSEKLSASTLESNEPVFHDGSPFSGFPKEYGFTVAAGINKPGKLYMIVVNQNEESPTSEEVKDGFNYRDVNVMAKASIEAPDPVIAYDIASITNLDPSTTYDVYVVAEDSSGTHIQVSPTRLQVTTSDVSLGTEVSLSSGYPKTGSINNTTAEFTVNTNRRSNLYYMVIPSGMSVSKDNVVAGQVIGDSQSFGRHLHVAAGNLHTLPDEEYQITIEGLDPGKSYDLCYVAANGYDGYYDSATVVSYVRFSTTGSSVPIVDLGITSQTETSFNLQVTSYSDAATAYYMVVPDGSIRPTFAQVKAAIGYEGVVPNSTGNFLLAESGYNYAEITGLTAASNYNVYVVVEDISNPNLHTTTPYRLDASTTGLKPPGIYGPNIKLLGDTSFYLEVGITRAGSIYYILVPRDSIAPTSTQVKTGFDYSNVSVIKSDSIVVEAHDVKWYEIIGLTPDTGYDLYVVAEADSVMHATPIKRSIQTNAPYVPIFSGNSPSIVNLHGDGFSITGTLENDADSIHYLILPQGQVAPTAMEVKDPGSYSGTKVLFDSVMDIKANVRFTFNINGLDENTTYDLYFVAEGTTGGLSTVPLKRSGTTIEALKFIEAPSIKDLRYYRITLEGMLNRRGDVYHVVVPDSSDAPTTQQVIDGINYGNVTIISSGLEENALYYSNVYSGLEPNRSYDIYLVLKETHGGGSGPMKIQITTPVMPGVAFSTNATSSPRAYISDDYIGVRLLVALNRPGTAYIARFTSDNLPTQQDVIDKAISGVYGVVIDIIHPDILYGVIKDWSTISYKLYIVVCDNETPKNYITPSPQEITVLNE